MTPRESHHLSVLDSFGDVYDYWMEPRGLDNPVGIRLPKDHVDHVMEQLKRAGMQPAVEIEDVERLVKRQEESNQQQMEKRGEMWKVLGRRGKGGG